MKKVTKAVFLVTHSMPGGAQEVWIDLGTNLRERGIDIQLVALYSPGATQKSALTPADLPWRHLLENPPASIFDYSKALFGLVGLLRSTKPDFIVAALPLANVMAPVASILTGSKCKVIVCHHSPTTTYSKPLEWLDRITGASGAVSAIVSVSKTVESTLGRKKQSYKKKSQVIYNALPPRIEHLLVSLAKNRGEKPGRTVVAAGRLSPEKNYEVVLRAAALLPDVTFRIIGEGPERANLAKLSRELSVESRVEFCGHLDREEALRQLAKGDVFVQPSFFEGHSLSLIEAAKLGLPLIVSNVPAQIEGITAADGTHCGISIAPRDEIALAAGIRLLLDDRVNYAKWQALSCKLSEKIEFEMMAKAYLQVIG